MLAIMDAFVWAGLVTVLLSVSFAVSAHVLRPWPAARFYMLAIGIPATYLTGGIVLADAWTTTVQAFSPGSVSGEVCAIWPSWSCMLM